MRVPLNRGPLKIPMTFPDAYPRGGATTGGRNSLLLTFLGSDSSDILLHMYGNGHIYIYIYICTHTYIRARQAEFARALGDKAH